MEREEFYTGAKSSLFTFYNGDLNLCFDAEWQHPACIGKP